MEDLALAETIADTHDDYDPWGECVVGFTERKELVVRFNLINNGKGEELFEDAVMKPGEVLELSKLLEVHVVDLPRALVKEFGKERNVMTSTEAYDVFQGVLDCLLDNHIRFRMKRGQA